MAEEKELCSVCEGNGVVKIPGGVSVCSRCHGDCWEPDPSVADLKTQLAASQERERILTDALEMLLMRLLSHNHRGS